MRKWISLFIATFVATGCFLVADDEQEIDIEKLSEAFGHYIGRNMEQAPVKLDLDAVIQGIRNGASGKAAPLTEQEFSEMMTSFQRQAYQKEAEKNLTEANAYLDKNKSNSGIIEIEPGKLQYLVLEQGRDPVVPEKGSPLIHYKGTYIDGTVFGSSEESGGPITIPLDQTIPGFSKGIVGMKEKEKRRLFVHPDLAYGMMGQLAPNALLIFDVEVIQAESPENSPTDEDVDEDAYLENLNDEDQTLG